MYKGYTLIIMVDLQIIAELYIVTLLKIRPIGRGRVQLGDSASI